MATKPMSEMTDGFVAQERDFALYMAGKCFTKRSKLLYLILANHSKAAG